SRSRDTPCHFPSPLFRSGAAPIGGTDEVRARWRGRETRHASCILPEIWKVVNKAKETASRCDTGHTRVGANNRNLLLSASAPDRRAARARTTIAETRRWHTPHQFPARSPLPARAGTAR